MIDIEHVVRKSQYLGQPHVIRFKIGNVSIHFMQRTFTSFLIAPEWVYIIVRIINLVSSRNDNCISWIHTTFIVSANISHLFVLNMLIFFQHNCIENSFDSIVWWALSNLILISRLSTHRRFLKGTNVINGLSLRDAILYRDMIRDKKPNIFNKKKTESTKCQSVPYIYSRRMKTYTFFTEFRPSSDDEHKSFSNSPAITINFESYLISVLCLPLYGCRDAVSHAFYCFRTTICPRN